ncbi:MAG TPA: RidA family protein [Gemmatimonadales bacterium]|nr:RidA family protein [Gemmatimonadales bacterium]
MNRTLLAATAALGLAACGPTASGPPGGGPGRIYPVAPPAPEFILAPNVPAIPGFSSAVKVGQTIYLAGQVPLDSTGMLVGRGDRPAQFKQALDNAGAIVRFARGVPADLVKLTVYCVGCTADDFDAMRPLATGFFPGDQGPALTVVVIAGLPDPDMLVAVDGVAVLRGTIPDRTRDPEAGTR